MKEKQFTYKDSGVDIEAGEQLVNSIKEVVKDTHNVSVLSNIGGFGALFQPDFSTIEEPVLVSSVDGVGTKLIVAFKAGIYNTVGQDLVNHCVNDIAVCGATPLFFMDYFSTGTLEKEIGFQVISGFAKACKENSVALIGGETAEMPDIYKKGEFDLAGTIVGVVDKSKLITGEKVQKGDLVVGFKSNGLHTNGYSLARNVLFSRFDIDESPDELNGTIGEELLMIHKSYLELINILKNINGVNGFSHITGGGLISNTNRVLPDGMSLNIEWNSWKRPEIFNLIQTIGNVQEKDMRRTFNLGIGLVAIIRPEVKDQVAEACKNIGEPLIEIGVVE